MPVPARLPYGRDPAGTRRSLSGCERLYTDRRVVPWMRGLCARLRRRRRTGFV